MILIVVLELVVTVELVIIHVLDVGRATVGRVPLVDDAPTIRGHGVVHVVILLRRVGFDNGLSGSGTSRCSASAPRSDGTRLQRRRNALKLVGGVIETKSQDDVVRELLVLGDGVAGERLIDSRAHNGELLRVSTLAGEEFREARCERAASLGTVGA